MTTEEKTHWLTNHLVNCLNEELPTVQGNYTFLPETIGPTKVLARECEVILHGRTVNTYDLDLFIELFKDDETITKESFAVKCTNHPVLNSWYLWNIGRGRISL